MALAGHGRAGSDKIPGTTRDHSIMKLLLRFFGFLFAAGTILFVVGVAAAYGEQGAA